MGYGLHEDEDIGNAHCGRDEHRPSTGELAFLFGVAEGLGHEEEGAFAGNCRAKD